MTKSEAMILVKTWRTVNRPRYELSWWSGRGKRKLRIRFLPL